MGTLYRETVAYKSRKLAKLCFAVTIFITMFDLVLTLGSLKSFIGEFILIGHLIVPLGIVISLVVWRRSKTSYRYAIINEELIIERLNGEKRKVELNINIRQIVDINDGEKESNLEKDVERKYKFSCTGKKSLCHRVVFKSDGKLYSFNFEPSNRLVYKIREIMDKKVTA